MQPFAFARIAQCRNNLTQGFTTEQLEDSEDSEDCMHFQPSMKSESFVSNLTVETKTVVNEDEFIQDILKPHLPYSLPLLRRCQFHTKQRVSAPNAEIWIATATECSNDPCSEPRKVDRTTNSPVVAKTTPFLAAHIDLTVSGQTQVWAFASWEQQYSTFFDPAATIQTSPQFSIYQKLFDTLFARIRAHHISKLGHDPPEQWRRLKTEGKIVSEPYSPSKVLFGTLAECHWLFLDNYNSQSSAVSRADRGYLKYVVTSTKSSLEAEARAIPRGLRFAPMPEEHLQTIIDRTVIPRTIETLRQLPNVGLFDSNDRPIAWGLLGKDASISSLHTEPDYRRQGLAELVALRLMRDQIKFFDDHSRPEDEAIIYSMADVSEQNIPSRKVMEKVGGKATWNVAWIEVDLGKR